MLLHQAFQIKLSIGMRHGLINEIFMSINHINQPTTHQAQPRNRKVIPQHVACDAQIKIRVSYTGALSRILKISVFLQSNFTRCIGPRHENGTYAAGLPGIHNVNLVPGTTGESSSPRRWSRGPCKAEKPTQVSPASAECPAPAAKSAPSGAHSGQNAPVS